MRTVLYPGSFDPVTNGHLDIIERASTIFDKVIVGIAKNSEKNALFSIEERKALLEKVCQQVDNIEIVSFDGLLVNAVDQFNVVAVIRGLRAVSDFEYEFQMALMNRELNKKCETLFMMPNPAYTFVSSRLIKEIINHSGNIEAFVPEIVVKALKEKVAEQ